MYHFFRAFLIVSFLTVIGLHGKSQGVINVQQQLTQSGSNYFQIVDSIDKLVEIDTLLKAPGKGYKDYLRWKEFWGHRVNSNEVYQEGTEQYANEAMLRLLANEPTCTTPDNLTSNWSCLGPFNQPSNYSTQQNMGWASAVYMDPADLNFALIGSRGGLYLSTNAQDPIPDWKNVLNSTKFPQMGITSIVINPTNHNEVWAATGSISGYGYGILHSFDVSATTPIWEVISPSIVPGVGTPGSNLNTIYKIIIDPNYATSKTLYVVYPDNVFKIVYNTSTSEFDSFNMGFPFGNKNLRDLEFDPHDPSNNSIAVSGDGVWRWNNTLATPDWEILLESSPPETISRALIAVTNSDIYAAYWSDFPDIEIDGFPGIECYTTNECQTFNDLAIFNAPLSWTILDHQSCILGTDSPYSTFMPIFEVHNNGGNEVFYVEHVLRYLMRGNVSGATIFWSQQGEYNDLFPLTGPDKIFMHGDIRSFQLVQSSAGGTSDKIFMGNDGGVLYSEATDAVNRMLWKNKNGNNYAALMFWGISSPESNPNLIFGGMQDNFHYKFHNNQWRMEEIGGDGGDPLINEKCIDDGYWNDPQYIANKRATTLLTVPIPRLLQDPFDYAFAGGGYYNPKSFIRPFAQDFFNGNLHIGHHDVYTYKVSEHCGLTTPYLPYDPSFNNFTLNNGVPICWAISAIEIAPKDHNIMYVSYQEPTYGRIPTLTGAYNDPSAWNVCNPGAPDMNYIGKKLFISSDGGISFSDITNNLPACEFFSITDIAVDENDPYHIWVTFDGFWYDAGHSVGRVYEINFDGINWTWVDISDGLPEFPVNCIRYENGTNDALYVGTDLGVYYRQGIPSASNPWQCFNNNLPTGIVNDLEINHCSGKIRASVWGHGIWESPLANSPKTDYIVSGTETWSGLKTVATNVVIPNGATLNIIASPIETNISFTEGKSLKVMPGGKLVVNNATLTNVCGSWWQGIEAVGNSLNLAQSIDQQAQIILDNATIENAYVAIRGGEIDATFITKFNQGGAIVKVDNSTFKNNWIGIQFTPFHRKVLVGGVLKEVNNLSYVRNSTFTTDAILTNPYHPNPNTFVTLWDNVGISFLNNTFQNTRTGITFDQAGYGIYSIDASYKVYPKCNVVVPFGTPCPSLDGNDFRNLYAGIWSGLGTGYDNITIDGNKFENCAYGVYMGATNYGSVTRNTFDIPKADGSIDIDLLDYQTAFGIYMESAYGHKIEGNTFNNFGNVAPFDNMGIYSADGGTISGNQIFLNDFTDLNFGVQTVNNNNLLNIDCNRFYKVASDGADIHHAKGTLANQGFCHLIDVTQPQANEFYGACDNTSTWQLYKNPIIATTFQYNSYPLSDINLDILNCVDNLIDANYCVPPSAYTRNVVCKPSSIGSGAVLIPILLAEKIVLNTQIISLKNQIDGGNTQDLINAINGTMNSGDMNSGELKNYISTYSPYLSDKVLASLINRSNPMSPGHLKQILLDNSPLTEAVLFNLTNKPLPTGHMNQIMNAQTGISSRQILENEINYYQAQAFYKLNELVSIYLDSIEVDSAIFELNKEGLTEAVCQLVQLTSRRDTSISKMHIEELKLIANEKEAIFPEDKMIEELREFCKFHELVMRIRTRVGGYLSMSADEKHNLENIASKLVSVAVNARSILDFVDNHFRYRPAEPLIYPDGTQRALQKTIIPQVNNSLKAYPNPFENNTIVSVEIADDLVNSQLTVSDITGQILKQYPITDKSFKITISLNNNNKGIYIATLYNKGKPVETIKLVQF